MSDGAASKASRAVSRRRAPWLRLATWSRLACCMASAIRLNSNPVVPRAASNSASRSASRIGAPVAGTSSVLTPAHSCCICGRGR